MNYYAIVKNEGLNGSGPALGIGTSKVEAWKDCQNWTDLTPENFAGDEYRCIEITEESFEHVQNGDPDAWRALCTSEEGQ